MYAIAINGSPRKGGNTEVMLKEVLRELENSAWETELIQVGGTPLRGCISCSQCFKNRNNQCAVNIDQFNEIFERMLRADAIIMGTPTYFADLNADLKAVVERAGYVAYANNHAFAGKIGAAVVAVRRGGSIHAYDSINHMYQMSQMIIPGSTYWNMGIGLKRGEVLEDAEGMMNMQHLGKSINWLAKAIQPVITDYPKAGINHEE